MGKATLGLSEILDKLKNEFEQIEKESDGKSKYGFDVKRLAVEIAFVVTKKGKGGINLAVVQAGGEYSNQEVHKIKLELKPYKIEEIEDEKTDYENWKIRGGYDKPRKSHFSLKRKAKKKSKHRKRHTGISLRAKRRR